jgi:hypothetical protein
LQAGAGDVIMRPSELARIIETAMKTQATVVGQISNKNLTFL